MFKKILVPVDLQEKSSWERALPAALRMAEDHGAELHLVTAMPPLPAQVYGYFPEDFEPKLMDDGKTALEAFVAEHCGGRKVVAHVDQGQPYDVIIALAKKLDVDLIVMGSHRPELKDYLLGPNAARVTRHATCSVMVVR